MKRLDVVMQILTIRFLGNDSSIPLSGISSHYELSSLARTQGSWVQIQLKAWMSMCVYSVFMLLCVYVAALRRADLPTKEPYRLCID
jgi:hypothetical protein